MGEHDDKVFMKRFGGILAGLVIVTILIIVISVGSDRLEPGDNPSRAILAEERVAPVGKVRTELPEVAVEVAPAQEPPATDKVASTGTIDGGALYANACMACHAAGVAGAPIPGTAAWAERAAIGLDALAASAIAGMGPIMQPKGGRADLSDDEIKAIVEHMMML